MYHNEYDTIVGLIMPSTQAALRNVCSQFF